LLRWELLEDIQPWGQRRDDYRAAVICWTLASVNHSGKGRKPQLKDFLKPFDFEPKPEQSDEELAALFKRMGSRKK
jgi:hypothetical protein